VNASKRLRRNAVKEREKGVCFYIFVRGGRIWEENQQKEKKCGKGKKAIKRKDGHKL